LNARAVCPCVALLEIGLNALLFIVEASYIGATAVSIASTMMLLMRSVMNFVTDVR